eukprot:scaffold86142_cov51-Attheya_sp.AAC.1
MIDWCRRKRWHHCCDLIGSGSESETQAGRREKRIRRHGEIRLWLPDAGKQGIRVWQQLRPEHNTCVCKTNLFDVADT